MSKKYNKLYTLLKKARDEAHNQGHKRIGEGLEIYLELISHRVHKPDLFSKPENAPPSLDEVIEYFRSKGYPTKLAERFFNYYDEPMKDRNGRVWKDQQGNTVKSWKQKAIAVWMNDKNKQQYEQSKKTKRFTPGKVDVRSINDDVEELFADRRAADSITKEEAYPN